MASCELWNRNVSQRDKGADANGPGPKGVNGGEGGKGVAEHVSVFAGGGEGAFGEGAEGVLL